jgi:hypothetical protein
MTQFFTLIDFIGHLKAIEHDMHALGPKIIEKVCQMVAAEAKRVIGKGPRAEARNNGRARAQWFCCQ